MIKIAVDVMSGDNSPHILINGAVRASREKDIHVIIVGNRSLIKDELLKHQEFDHSKVSICHADDVIEMHESPAKTCKSKPNSSVMVSARLVANGEANAYVSPGNSGATMTASLLNLKRIKGIKRPAIATPMPRLNGSTLLLDAGANMDSKPEHLLQQAIIGSIYVSKMSKIKKPKVALLSIGEESVKGNDLVFDTYKLLKKEKTINFIGNVEGKDLNTDKCDVVICDGFVGNVVLKVSEGVASVVIKFFKQEIKKSIVRRLVAFFLLPVFAALKSKVDAKEHGGALLLGTNGITIISHGNADDTAICNAIKFAAVCVGNDLNLELKGYFKR
ncbi:MAG: phosphate acyltransferase PlsX [bacterium]|nr:phosphate acyltransferase PlsX [bacterium]